MITPQHWEKAISYNAYRAMIDALVAEGKTTGEQQSDKLLDYTRMNLRRMSRWDKTAELSADLQASLPAVRPQKWLVLSEGWCGDAAQNLPIIAKMADANPHIELRILLRDEHLDLMDLYLTNGGRAIPKLIAFEQPTTNATEWKELFTWGARPKVAQELVEALKRENTPFEELAEHLHKWYSDDKTLSTQKEFLELLR